MAASKQKALDSFRWIDTQKILFVFSFFLGTLGILLIRELGFSVIWSLFFVISIMISYAAFGITRKYLLRPDILGDNLYYLGFLFTLVSLAYTLFKFSSEEANVDYIIQNFGLGLGSTLLGLVFRVFFNQSREDPELYEKAVRLSLAEAAAELIGETAKIRDDLLTFKISLVQSVEGSVNSMMSEFSNGLKEITAESVRAIYESTKDYSQSLQTVSSTFVQTSKELNSSSTKILDSIENSVYLFNSSSKDLVEGLKSLASTLGELNSNEVGGISAPIDLVKNNLITLNEGFETPIRSLETLAQSINLANQSLNGFSESGLDELTIKLVNASSKVDETIISLNNAISSYNKLAESVQKEIGDIKNESIDFENNYKESLTKIRSMVSESEDSLQMLQKSLTSVANKIVEKLK